MTTSNRGKFTSPEPAAQCIIAGQVIALEGDAGKSFGCHVHFSLEHDGGFTDPMTILQ